MKLTQEDLSTLVHEIFSEDALADTVTAVLIGAMAQQGRVGLEELAARIGPAPIEKLTTILGALVRRKAATREVWVGRLGPYPSVGAAIEELSQKPSPPPPADMRVYYAFNQ